MAVVVSCVDKIEKKGVLVELTNVEEVEAICRAQNFFVDEKLYEFSTSRHPADLSEEMGEEEEFIFDG